MNKKVMFGTTKYHETMRQIASNSLQRMAGYIAPKMAASEIQTTTVPTVHVNYLKRVDPMMQALANDESLMNCNPRAPYLLLAWMLVGSDNPYRSSQYVEHTRIHKKAAIIHIRIALGDIPLEREINSAGVGALEAGKPAVWAMARATAGAEARAAAWDAAMDATRAAIANFASDAAKVAADDAANGMARATLKDALRDEARFALRDAARDATRDTIRDAIANKAFLFAQIDDYQALSIARQLTIDILELKDCNNVEPYPTFIP